MAAPAIVADHIGMSLNKMLSVTCTAPVNIAVVKYWGKRDEELILPVNSSLSVTLDQSELCARTTVAVSRDFTKDRMWLNGGEVSIGSKRYQNVLKEIRRRARKRKNEEIVDNFLQWHVHVCSENNFPTAAGLASSAAGLACLVFALGKLFKVEGDLSEIARQGSGSACRSMHGGFVEWNMGTRPNGSDSIAKQIAPKSHWPEMKVLVLVVSAKKKPIGSSAGMQVSVETSDLLQHRVHQVVPERMRLMTKVILHKDFQTFAELTMKDSNQLHAVCLDTYPPISYMTDTSRDIIRMVHAINTHHEEIKVNPPFGECGNIINKVAYTFDAGPNACLYLLDRDVPMVMRVVKHVFPVSEGHLDNFIRGAPIEKADLSQELIEALPVPSNPDAIQYAIHTRVGPGPQILTNANDSLLGNDGLPKTIKS